MKSTHIFFKDSIYRIDPLTETDRGAPIPLKLVTFLEQNVNLEELGQKALEALNIPITLVPHPKNQDERTASSKLWYKAMKIKSWKSFAKGAKMITLYLQEDKIKILPSKNEQPKGFFTATSEEKPRFCLLDDPTALGQAIISAFNDCE